MPFNGNGTFVLPGPPLEPGEIVSSDEHNELRDDMASGFTDCVTRDGQSPAVANLPMGGFKHTNVGAANTLTNYSRVDQVQNDSFNWLTLVSGTDTITAASAIAPAAYAAGQRFTFVAANDNTGAVTININSLGAKYIKINGNNDLNAGFLKQGAIYLIIYDGTAFQVSTIGAVTTADLVNYTPEPFFGGTTTVQDTLRDLQYNNSFAEDSLTTKPFTNDYTTNPFVIVDGVAINKHYHGAAGCIGLNGRMHLVAKKADKHAFDVSWEVSYRWSDDGGRTWSAEQIIVPQQANKAFSPSSILMTPKGKLIVTYSELNASGGVATTPSLYKTTVSYDNGATWIAGATLDSINFTYARTYGRMKIIPAPNTSAGYRLGVTSYQRTQQTPANYECSIYYSDDDGDTWTKGTSISAPSTSGYNETEFCPVTDKVWFAVARATSPGMFVTTNAGATWTKLGDINKLPASVGAVAPTLDKFRKNGKWYLVLGMARRDNSFNNTAWLVGLVDELVTDKEAWSSPVVTNAGTMINASGYQTTFPKPNGELEVEGGMAFVNVLENYDNLFSKLLFNYLDLLAELRATGRTYTTVSEEITVSETELEAVCDLYPEGGVVANLVTINGGYEGQILTFKHLQATSNRDVWLLSGSGNLQLNGDAHLLVIGDQVVLQKNGSVWYELSRSHNLGAVAYNISSGAITVGASTVPRFCYVDTEGGAATDDLDTINGGSYGQMITFSSVTNDRDVTFKDGTGNLLLSADFILNRGSDTITLVCDGTNWREVCHSNNED